MADFIIGRAKCDDLIIFLGLHILTFILSALILIKANCKVPPREHIIL